MSEAPRLTDRAALALHRKRAASAPEPFLLDQVAVDLEERLAEVNKTFTAPALVAGVDGPFRSVFPTARFVPDDPRLGLTTADHDLVIHAMALHWADDPIGQLVQSRLALKPDGLFLASFFGGQTLHELRTALAEAEARLSGGLSPRVLPMADLRDAGALLQRAGFALPVADTRTLTVRYHSLSQLVRDLRGIGETNSLAHRHRATPPRNLFPLAEDIYRTHFSDDGYLLATFEIVTLTGWSPDASQQKPLRPGSARARLADALGVAEHPARDIFPPGKR
jgi:SAM-dependent methyltransferase